MESVDNRTYNINTVGRGRCGSNYQEAKVFLESVCCNDPVSLGFLCKFLCTTQSAKLSLVLPSDYQKYQQCPPNPGK